MGKGRDVALGVAKEVRLVVGDAIAALAAQVDASGGLGRLGTHMDMSMGPVRIALGDMEVAVLRDIGTARSVWPIAQREKISQSCLLPLVQMLISLGQTSPSSSNGSGGTIELNSYGLQRYAPGMERPSTNEMSWSCSRLGALRLLTRFAEPVRRTE